MPCKPPCGTTPQSSNCARSSPSEAAAYLLHGQAGPARRQWEQVGAYLTHNPESVAARTLDNPLTLSLTRDTYAGQDPAELTDPAIFPTVDALREHLIDQVLVTAYPDEKQRARATWWLAWIARRMGTSRDLPWWDIPTWIPRWQLRLIRVLIIAFAVGLVVGITDGFAGGPGQGLLAGLVLGILGGLVFGLGLGRRGEPRTLAPRWPRLGELRRTSASLSTLVIWLSLGLLFGLLTGAAFGPVTGLAVGLAIGLAVGLRDLWGSPSADSRSATGVGTYRADLRTSMIHGLAVGIVIGLAVGLVNELTFGFASGLANRLVAGFAYGFAFGLAAGLGTGQVPRVKFTEFVVTCRRQDRVRFLRLLEDASTRQVLRQAGVVYQFRHAALQDRLATMGTRHDLRTDGQGEKKRERRMAEPA